MRLSELASALLPKQEVVIHTPTKDICGQIGTLLPRYGNAEVIVAFPYEANGKIAIGVRNERKGKGI